MNLELLFNFYKSKTAEALNNYDTTKLDFFDEKQTKFLSTKPKSTVAFASYPRSGNSFLRKYIDNITGVATGSDVQMVFNTNTSL